MSGLRLTLRQTPPLGTRINLSALTSRCLAELTRAQIGQLQLNTDDRMDELGEWFAIEPISSDRIELAGDLRQFDYIGDGLRDAEIQIEGDVGDYLGHNMRSGSIRVQGNAGNYCGGQLKGGAITVGGDAGHGAGGARISERRGMQGGQLIIQGNTLSHAGHRMRRGCLVVHGNVGYGLGLRMIAGSIVVCGKTGMGIGCGMRRGTVLLLSAIQASETTQSFPSFSEAEECELSFLPILLKSLCPHLPIHIRQGFSANPVGLPRRGIRCLGDRSISGLGEIICL